MSPLPRTCYAIAVLSVLLPAAPAPAQVIDLLHSFTGGTTDGQNPAGALTLSGTTLLGMTPEGGSGGDGTIFQMGLDGSGFGTIHNFRGGLTDGDTPLGTLALAGPNLVGMTQAGGSATNAGTVFQINTAGSGFNIFHAFVGGPDDGFNALGSPVVSGAAIYGMTMQGGTANLGTVFKQNLDGTGFTVIHSFAGGAGDGQAPGFSSVVVSGSVIYGMTPEGGTAGQGIVFRMNTDGSNFTVLHSFVPSTGDGWDPLGSLTLVGNTLYGTTKQGGGGAGTIFEINTDGSNYNRLHTFTGQLGGDGANPFGSLTLAGSTLFGTTPTGGADALGVLFGINLDGSGYSILHTFTGGPNDGANPGDLIFADSTFYGMTGAGGADNLGTVYSFTPIPEPSSFLLLAAAAIPLAALRWWRRHRLSRTPIGRGTDYLSPHEPALEASGAPRGARDSCRYCHATVSCFGSGQLKLSC